MSVVQCIRCLLVLVDTFSGWVEAFPTTNKRTQRASDLLLLQGIILHSLVPTSLQMDNGPQIISQIAQNSIRSPQHPLTFHNPYHPQFLGKIEQTNHSLKKQTCQTLTRTLA